MRGVCCLDASGDVEDFITFEIDEEFARSRDLRSTVVARRIQCCRKPRVVFVIQISAGELVEESSTQGRAGSLS